MSGLSGLTSVWHRLAKADRAADGDRPRDDRAGPEAIRVGDCRARAMCSFAGVLSSVTLPPRSQTPHLVAELFDGSGHVTLVWMGRRDIPGIRPGARLHVTGRVMMKKGRPVMFNPAYDLLAPEAMA